MPNMAATQRMQNMAAINPKYGCSKLQMGTLLGASKKDCASKNGSKECLEKYIYIYTYKKRCILTRVYVYKETYLGILVCIFCNIIGQMGTHLSASKSGCKECHKM